MLSPLRLKGLRISAYLDDYLICTQSRERMEQDTEMLMSYLTNQNLLCQELVDSISGEIISTSMNILRMRNLVSFRTPPYEPDGFIAVSGLAEFAQNEEFPAVGSCKKSVSSQTPLVQSERISGMLGCSSSM